MTTYASAKNQDPSLYCAYFGGPRDGLKSGDLPDIPSRAEFTSWMETLRRKCGCELPVVVARS